MKLLFLVLAIAVMSCGATSSLKNYLDMGLYSFQEEESFAPAPVAEAPVAEAPVAETGEPAYIADAPVAEEPVAPEPPVYEAPVAPTAEVGEPAYIADAPVAEEPVAPEPPVYEAPVAEVGEPVYIADAPVYEEAAAPEPPVYEAPVAPTAEVGEPVYIADAPIYGEAAPEATYAEEPVEAEPTFGERLDQQIYSTTSTPEPELEAQPAAQTLNDRANDPQVRASIELGIQALLEAGRNAGGVLTDVTYSFESLDNLVDLNNSHQFTVTLTDGADRRIYLTFSVVDENGSSRVTNGCIKAGRIVRV